MLIIPAIDIKDGHCVRLKQGEMSQATVFSEDPAAVARHWVEQGAVYGVLPAQTSAVSRTDRLDAGRRLFGMVCLPCHQANGQGLPDRFPPLAASDFLNADNAKFDQRIVLDQPETLLRLHLVVIVVLKSRHRFRSALFPDAIVGREFSECFCHLAHV